MYCRLSRDGVLHYLPKCPFPASSRTHFHRVQEHPNRNSDEEVMTFRSWRSHMTRQPYLYCLPYLPECPFRPTPAPTALQRHMAGNLTQWAFHIVQEHPNRSSDEEVMTFRSQRSCMILTGRNPFGVNPSGVNPSGVNPSGTG